MAAAGIEGWRRFKQAEGEDREENEGRREWRVEHWGQNKHDSCRG